MGIYLVEGVSRWDMKDEQTGAAVQGSKIYVKHINDEENYVDTKDKKGSFPTTFNLPMAAFGQFERHVPGFFEIEFDMRVGSKGQFTVKRAEFIENYSEGDTE